MNFVKKNFKLIVGIIIGTILISGISVYATTTYLASNVTYNNTNVASALDELYTRSSTYKNLTQTTTATASDILSGKTAYSSSGTLITGEYEPITTTKGTEWNFYGNTIPANGQISFNIGFENPSEIWLMLNNGEHHHVSRFLKTSNGYTRIGLHRKIV